jgi:phosphate acyltransferase
MGGDYGLDVVIPASLLALKEDSQLYLTLVGDEQLIKKKLKKAINNDRLTVVNATEVVSMDELPSHALRNKKDSSMRKAINLVKERKAHACVSAGNTGALMAIARFVLKTLPGIDRPAIISELPTSTGKTRVIDLGANVDSSADHLFQFAVMGSQLVSAVDGVKHPKIGLLNIGVEEIKGNDQVKRTAHMLAENQAMNYIGYIEGDDIFSGGVDLVVCDGFVGNIALKASEGLAKLMMRVIKESFNKNILTRAVGLLAIPIFTELKKKMDPTCYNGASLLGLNGIVVKSHGGTNVRGFKYAIQEAVLEARNDVTELVRNQITELMNQGFLL